MSDGPESPPPETHEVVAKPALRPEVNRSQSNREAREKRDPVEVVAECPTFRRQMLFTRPFSIYGDVIDAAEQKNAKQEKHVPAIHFVLDVTDDGARLCVGDDDGEKLGWINRDDNSGYEWNVRSVWKPERSCLITGRIPIYLQPERSTASLELQVSDKTLFPILEVKRDAAGKAWYKVGPSLGGDTFASKIRNPVWIPKENDNGLRLRANDGTPNLLATKKQITDFNRSLKLVIDEWENSSPAERRPDSSVNALRIAYIRILSGKQTAISTEEQSQGILEFLADRSAAHGILSRDAWSNLPYLQIDNFKKVLQCVQARLRAIENGDTTDATPSIVINGKAEMLYRCIVF